MVATLNKTHQDLLCILVFFHVFFLYIKHYKAFGMVPLWLATATSSRQETDANAKAVSKLGSNSGIWQRKTIPSGRVKPLHLDLRGMLNSCNHAAGDDWNHKSYGISHQGPHLTVFCGDVHLREPCQVFQIRFVRLFHRILRALYHR